MGIDTLLVEDIINNIFHTDFEKIPRKICIIAISPQVIFYYNIFYISNVNVLVHPVISTLLFQGI